MSQDGKENQPLIGGDRSNAGRWDESRHSRNDLLPAPAPWWNRRGWKVFLGMGLALLGLLILAVVVIVGNLPDKQSMYEEAAVRSLRAIQAAQAQYHQQYGCYADAAWRLNQDRRRIGENLKNEFGDWQGNGDEQVPQPKDGYDYRMLQSDDPTNPRGWYVKPQDPTAGLSHWAATARAAEPGTTGDHQFYITETGEIYQCPEPMAGMSSYYKRFLLDVAPLAPPPGWELVR